MSDSAHGTLHQKVRAIIRPWILESRTEIDVNTVAAAALNSSDEATIRLAAEFAFREVARSLLRRYYPREDPSEQLELAFPHYPLVQRRYPRAHSPGATPTYVLTEKMSQEDFAWNLAQFDRDIAGRKAHRRQFHDLMVYRLGFDDPDAEGYQRSA